MIGGRELENPRGSCHAIQRGGRRHRACVSYTVRTSAVGLSRLGRVPWRTISRSAWAFRVVASFIPVRDRVVLPGRVRPIAGRHHRHAGSPYSLHRTDARGPVGVCLFAACSSGVNWLHIYDLSAGIVVAWGWVCKLPHSRVHNTIAGAQLVGALSIPSALPSAGEVDQAPAGLLPAARVAVPTIATTPASP